MSNTYNKFSLKKIKVQKSADQYPVVKEILDRHRDKEVTYFTSLDELIKKTHSAGDFDTLVLARQEGAFFKRCPCTGKHIGCGYNFLNIATNCSIDCSYCILKGYLNNPLMTLYVNFEDMFHELDSSVSIDKHYRIGTGELTDSLLLEPFFSVAEKLIPWFMQRKNLTLELKTKTVSIDNIMKFSPERNIVISWSLNPQKIISKEEPGAASLDERLEAAQRCIERGYLTGFHFDPVITYTNWHDDYKEVIEKLFSVVDCRYIAWISLGAIRYPASLDNIIRRKHPDSIVYSGELINGKDGKFRYFRPLREEIFRYMNHRIKEKAEVPVYLCMESREVWENTIGLPDSQSVSDYLDQAVLRFQG